VTAILLFALLGLAPGALIAGLGVGLVQIYRATGVVSFAQGAVVMYSAYVFASAKGNGEYPIPPLPNPLVIVQAIANGWFGARWSVPTWPTMVSLGGPVPTGLAIVLALATAVAIGVAMHYLVFTHLRRSPQLARVVASVGVLLVLQAIAARRFGSGAVPVPSLLTAKSWRVLGGSVPIQGLVVAGIVVVIAVVVSLLYRRSRFGFITHAAAENEDAAIMLGHSPATIALVNWVLASLLAGALGVLLGSITTSVDPTIVALTVVPALAAALVGRFSSVITTLWVGLLIGILQSEVIYLQALSWWPTTGGAPLPGISDAIPFAIIAVVLLVRHRRSLPGRGEREESRLPRVPTPRHVGVPAIGALIIGTVVIVASGATLRASIINSLIGAVLCLSLVVLTGFVGQISLAQFAFAGFGGILLSKFATSIGIPFPFGILLAAAATGAAGVLIGIPALRIRGVQLAIVTLSLGAVAQSMLFNNPLFAGGPSGAPVSAPSLFGATFGPSNTFIDRTVPSASFGIFVLVVLILIAVPVALIRRSQVGRIMLAVRSNERAAAATGIKVAHVKVMAFGLSAVIAGIGGGLLAYQNSGVDPTAFGPINSLTILAFAYIGGVVSISGAVIGGLLVSQGVGFYVLSSLINVTGLYDLIGGVGLILAAVLQPDGSASVLAETARKIRHRFWKPRVGHRDLDTQPIVTTDPSHTNPATSERMP
jgi:branched-chain amino acid transport system permease protein